MPTSPFRIKNTIGRSYTVDPDDTHNTKVALQDLGYFETPSFGITPYPDGAMFQGIEEFQDDFGLRKDGLINPGGETERKLNEVIGLKKRSQEGPLPSEHRIQLPKLGPSTDNKSKLPVDGPTDKDRRQVAALPLVIPAIVYEIAIFFGMSLTAAYAWWISRPAEDKRKVREQIESFMEGGYGDSPSEVSCAERLGIDMTTCKQIQKKRGKQAAARCYATANQRYAACLRGFPHDQLPPLDTWNN